MTAAGVQAQFFGGSSSLPTGVNAETGVTWNREDTQTGNTPIPIPASAGVNFSYLKVLQLAVTVAATTTSNINNRTVRTGASLASSLAFHWKTDSQANWNATFSQTVASKAPTDTVGSNNAGSTPSGYTTMTTSPVQYDNTSQNPTVLGIGSTLLMGITLAVDGAYAGGPGTATLGTIILGYDET